MIKKHYLIASLLSCTLSLPLSADSKTRNVITHFPEIGSWVAGAMTLKYGPEILKKVTIKDKQDPNKTHTQHTWTSGLNKVFGLPENFLATLPESGEDGTSNVGIKHLTPFYATAAVMKTLLWLVKTEKAKSTYVKILSIPLGVQKAKNIIAQIDTLHSDVEDYLETWNLAGIISAKDVVNFALSEALVTAEGYIASTNKVQTWNKKTYKYFTSSENNNSRVK